MPAPKTPQLPARGTFGTTHSLRYLEISRILFRFLSYVPTYITRAAALISDQGAVNPSPKGKTLLPSPHGVDANSFWEEKVLDEKPTEDGARF